MRSQECLEGLRDVVQYLLVGVRELVDDQLEEELLGLRVRGEEIAEDGDGLLLKE